MTHRSSRLAGYLFQLYIAKHEYKIGSKEILDLEFKINMLKKLYDTSIYKALTEDNE